MKAMHNVADSRARVNGCFNKRFEVTVGIHQSSVLSLLLFAIVMEALSHDCCIGCPWQLLYGDDIVIMGDNLEDLQIQLHSWRTSLDNQGLRVNVAYIYSQTKIFGLLGEAQKPTRNVKLEKPQYFARPAISGFIKYTWGVKGTQKEESMFRCKKCKGESVSTGSLNSTQVHVSEDTFKAVPTFQYFVM